MSGEVAGPATPVVAQGPEEQAQGQAQGQRALRAFYVLRRMVGARPPGVGAVGLLFFAAPPAGGLVSSGDRRWAWPERDPALCQPGAGTMVGRAAGERADTGRHTDSTRLTIVGVGGVGHSPVGDIQVERGMLEAGRCRPPGEERAERTEREEGSAEAGGKNLERTGRSRTGGRQDKKGKDKGEPAGRLGGGTCTPCRRPFEMGVGRDETKPVDSSAGLGLWRSQARERGQGLSKTSWGLRWNVEEDQRPHFGMWKTVGGVHDRCWNREAWGRRLRLVKGAWRGAEAR